MDGLSNTVLFCPSPQKALPNTFTFEKKTHAHCSQGNISHKPNLFYAIHISYSIEIWLLIAGRKSRTAYAVPSKQGVGSTLMIKEQQKTFLKRCQFQCTVTASENKGPVSTATEASSAKLQRFLPSLTRRARELRGHFCSSLYTLTGHFPASASPSTQLHPDWLSTKAFPPALSLAVHTFHAHTHTHNVCSSQLQAF